MTDLRIIEPAAWRAQPWRNGAGVTHELVRWPDAEPFAIRISVAEITAPAPFSAFAGHRRWLYLLDGGPVTLAREGGELVLADPADGFAFAGTERIAATGVARPSRDLNIMVRDDLPARVELLRGPVRRAAGGALAAVFAIAGEVRVALAERGADAALARHACAWCTSASVSIELAAGAIAAALVVDAT